MGMKIIRSTVVASYDDITLSTGQFFVKAAAEREAKTIGGTVQPDTLQVGDRRIFTATVKDKDGNRVATYADDWDDQDPKQEPVQDVWDTMSPRLRLNLLSNESSIDFNLLAEDPDLVSMVKNGEPKENCLAHINEHW